MAEHDLKQRFGPPELVSLIYSAVVEETCAVRLVSSRAKMPGATIETIRSTIGL